MLTTQENNHAIIRTWKNPNNNKRKEENIMKSKKNYLTKLSQEDIDVLVVQVQKTIEKNNTLIKVLNSRLKEIDKEQLKECKNIGDEDNV